MQGEGFEQFLQARYPTAKRFSLEGGESLIAILHELVEKGAATGVEEIVLGMPHRGRLNVLVNVLRKPYEMVLAEFEGSLLAREATGDGDVKYHLGYSRDHTTAGRPQSPPLAQLQPEPPRSGEPAHRGHGAGQAEPPGRHRTAAGDARS